MAGATLRRCTRVKVSLRPLVPADAAWLDPWLADVVALLGCDVAVSAAALCRRAAQDRAVRARAIERDGPPIGVALYTLDRPGRAAATIDLVATSPGQARRGAGMTAARLAEGEMRAAGISRVYAPAPATHGIAVYFWIRLGYRPLLRPAWPSERPGVGWLMRDITAGASGGGRRRAPGAGT